ncbi:MAG TPA: PepSY domain-containing protein [Bacillales bacterium]|nr:PepSY domain-containing protein [Bacillales bacterium]
MKSILVAAAIILGLSGIAGGSAQAQQTINSDKASAIAMQNVHGEILNVGLEHESNQLVYDVDMKTRLGHLELIINAYTGKIMEMKKPIRGAAK